MPRNDNNPIKEPTYNLRRSTRTSGKTVTISNPMEEPTWRRSIKQSPLPKNRRSPLKSAIKTTSTPKTILTMEPDYNSEDDSTYVPGTQENDVTLDSNDEADMEDESDEEVDADESDSFIASDNDVEDEDEEFVDKKGLLALLTRSLNKQLSEELCEESDCSDDSDIERFTKPKNKKKESLYRQIKDTIKSDTPTINKLLQMNMPFKVQCELFEKIKILTSLSKYSEEYGNLKTNINHEVERYTRSKMKTKDYTKYDTMENVLMNTESLTMPLKYRILSSDLSDNNKKIVFEKYLTLKNLDIGDSNHGKLTEWIDWALSIPSKEKKIAVTNKNNARNKFISSLRAKLDKRLYGMDLVKEEIMCVVNDYITKKGSSNKGLALVGNPGIGKTTLIRILAECLDIPFQQICLGGVKDASFLNGHSYTYEGAKPGAIVEALRRMEHKNGIIFFDEFDKISSDEKGMEVINVLLHITDSTQNSEFKDMYMPELSIDLSKIWFIYSMNDEKRVNPVLRDRIPILKLKDYQESDKQQIFMNHLLPDALKIYNYTTNDICITKETVLYLIKKIRKESGVRDLKRSIEMIIKKIHFLKSCKLKNNSLGNIKISFDLTHKNVDLMKKIEITQTIIDTLLADSGEPKPYLSMYL
jgi:ATP-dependent Lon protease